MSRMSQRRYAARIGVTHVYIDRLIRRGKLPADEHGKVDPVEADAALKVLAGHGVASWIASARAIRASHSASPAGVREPAIPGSIPPAAIPGRFISKRCDGYAPHKTGRTYDCAQQKLEPKITLASEGPSTYVAAIPLRTFDLI